MRADDNDAGWAPDPASPVPVDDDGAAAASRFVAPSETSGTSPTSSATSEASPFVAPLEASGTSPTSTAASDATVTSPPPSTLADQGTGPTGTSPTAAWALPTSASPATDPSAAPSTAPAPAWPQSSGSQQLAPGEPPAPVPPHTPTHPPTTLPPSARATPVRRRGVGTAVVVLVALVSLLVGVIAGLFGSRWLPSQGADGGAGLPTSGETGGGSPAGDDWVTAVAATALASTVFIEVEAGGQAVSGSGFVVREDGYIATNHHVVEPAVDGDGTIEVLFSDGEKVPAEVVGSTPDYDLAVLKIDLTGLAPLVLGDSDTLAAGDPVLAVGAPLGLAGSVTLGIVSAVGRPVTVRDPEAEADDPGSYINAIQTDAAINRGNSGGPLIDAAGEVIGVNTAVAYDGTTGGGNQPGFAIPSTQVRHTVEQLIADGVATYPVIGVVLDQRYDGEGVQVLVESSTGDPTVTPGGPADDAGIRPGDVIVAVDGEPVSRATELVVKVRSRLPGETVTLTIRTDGGDRDVDVVLGEQVSE